MKRFTINTHLQTVLILGAFLFAMPFLGNAQSSTEVDDLYFSKSDRVQIKYGTDEEGNKVAQSQATYQAYSNDSYDPGYSAKKVNPEYIAKYKSASRESVQDQLNEQSQLDEQENPNYSNEDYYVEGYDTQGYSSNGSTVVNVYNGNGWNSMRPYNNFAFNSWNSPFWNPGWGFSIGYSWGWGGFGYGSPWGFYDPWMASAWGSPWGGFYDPWYGPSWGFNRWSRWNSPFYGGGWGYSNWAYNTGYYDGYYVGKSAGLDARNVVRGGRVNRSAVAGNTYASNGVSTRYRNPNAVNVTGSRDTGGATRGRTVSSSTSARDYSGTQNEYFQRSRMGYSSGVGTNDRNTRAVTSRTSAREEYQNTARSRSSYTPAETTRSRNSVLENRTEPSNSRSVNSQRSSGSEFRGVNPDNSRRLNSTPPAREQVRPDNNNTNRSRSGYSTPPARETYSPPSRSRSNNTISTPSYRNNGSGSRSTPSYSAPSRSSSPGRSSSPSYSAPSRSGGSFSAPSPSRSSGSSSGSRSSGSSSGGSRRGGN